jgi:hypothetical protein
MSRPTTLVTLAIVLAIPVLVWQAVSAEALNELAWVRVPMNGMNSESSTLLMIAGLLIGASCLARRAMREKA